MRNREFEAISVMPPDQVDDALVLAWLTARSIARGLPLPVLDHDGYRVDTNSETETCRWVFTRPSPGLSALGATLHDPNCLLKLCGTAEDLLAALPSRWQLHSSAYFMSRTVQPSISAKPLPAGYELVTMHQGATTSVKIFALDRTLAASGFAAETAHAFVYDRIATVAKHRRLGLGSIVMTELAKARRAGHIPELLVATEDGHKLYSQLGWAVRSPYSTAVISEIFAK